MSGLIERHGESLPPSVREHPITLGEGSTPLLRLDRIRDARGLNFDLYCKFEGANPTGSFKDRGIVSAIAHAKSNGKGTVICASTGNTSASAAAYSGLAGMRCVVLMPEGKVASGKVAQAVMHDAEMLQVRGNFDDAMELVKEIGGRAPIEIVNSTNPMRLQGQKTLALEVIDELGRAPDYHALPVGNAGNITAHWIGYSEARGKATAACSHCGGEGCPFLGKKRAERAPRLVGYQAEGAAPFVAGAFVAEPETVASAIRIGQPQSWDAALLASRESGGWFAAVSDAEILDAQALLASSEGVFCEPASAAPVAGVLNDAAAGKFEDGSAVVCTVTGHGLKDPSVADARMRRRTIDASIDALEEALGERQ